MPASPRLTPRPAAGVEDLRRAEALLARAWVAEAPFVAGTVAGLEWWHASSWPDPLDAHLRLWRDATTGGDVAWTWVDGPEVEWHVWSGDPDRDPAVARALLEALVDEVGDRPLHAWSAEDDEATLRHLRDLGFEPDTTRLSQWQRHVATEPPLGAASLPEGYTIRSLRGPEDLAARVEVHRAAFTPSRLTVEKYERLTGLPHYRFEDDLVVEGPDGSLAAFAMTWWDAHGAVGEFEPVGTHPDHQRRGLARALLQHGVRRFADRGARIVQVYSDTATEAAEALYPAVGFRRRAFHRRHARPGAPTGPTPGSDAGVASGP